MPFGLFELFILLFETSEVAGRPFARKVYRIGEQFPQILDVGGGGVKCLGADERRPLFSGRPATRLHRFRAGGHQKQVREHLAPVRARRRTHARIHLRA